ncbi:hypothetical protein DEH69_18015 [Streptomyces sp. PT12]|nr:hypothetical protein DEH69_18015 [Streptomyces sp. PT12]
MGLLAAAEAGLFAGSCAYAMADAPRESKPLERVCRTVGHATATRAGGRGAERRRERRWLGPGSNRRPSAFQAVPRPRDRAAHRPPGGGAVRRCTPLLAYGLAYAYGLDDRALASGSSDSTTTTAPAADSFSAFPGLLA